MYRAGTETHVDRHVTSSHRTAVHSTSIARRPAVAPRWRSGRGRVGRVTYTPGRGRATCANIHVLLYNTSILVVIRFINLGSRHGQGQPGGVRGLLELLQHHIFIHSFAYNSHAHLRVIFVRTYTKHICEIRSAFQTAACSPAAASAAARQPPVAHAASRTGWARPSPL